MTASLSDGGPIKLTATETVRDMIWIPGGTFRMGSDRHYPEECEKRLEALKPKAG